LSLSHHLHRCSSDKILNVAALRLRFYLTRALELM
jgi:hypothetical protein